MTNQYAVVFNQYGAGTASKSQWRGIITKGGQFVKGGSRGGFPDGWNKWTPVRIKDVTDGTSKTFAIMEKGIRSSNVDRGNPSITYSENPGWIIGGFQPTMRSSSLPPSGNSYQLEDGNPNTEDGTNGPIGPFADQAEQGDPNNSQSFGGPHAGG